MGFQSPMNVFPGKIPWDLSAVPIKNYKRIKGKSPEMANLENKKISAFEKRLKRRIGARVHDFFAVCPPGLKNICLTELKNMGNDINEISPQPGGIAFKGKLPQGCLANMTLGTPSKILMRIASFKADNFSTLEKYRGRSIRTGKSHRCGNQCTSESCNPGSHGSAQYITP